MHCGNIDPHLPFEKFEFQFRPLHLLAIGRDTEVISRLLRLAQTCTDKSFAFTTGVSLSGRVSQDKYQSARYFVEGKNFWRTFITDFWF